MSFQQIKQLIADKKFKCPSCSSPVQKFDKFTEITQSVWDGPGDSGLETQGSKVTLICGSCDWTERTEYWSNYIDEG